MKNRTQLAKLRSTNLCEPCAATAQERERRRRAKLEIERRRRNAEDADTVHRVMRAYVLAHPNLPDEPDGASMYVDIPVPERGSSTVRLRDLNTVRQELVNRLQP